MKNIIALCLLLGCVPAVWAGEPAYTIRPTELKAKPYSDAQTLTTLPPRSTGRSAGAAGELDASQIGLFHRLGEDAESAPGSDWAEQARRQRAERPVQRRLHRQEQQHGDHRHPRPVGRAAEEHQTQPAGTASRETLCGEPPGGAALCRGRQAAKRRASTIWKEVNDENESDDSHVVSAGQQRFPPPLSIWATSTGRRQRRP